MESSIQLKCLRCGHKWLRRDLKKLPTHCPNRKCNSPYWNKLRKGSKGSKRGTTPKEQNRERTR